MPRIRFLVSLVIAAVTLPLFAAVDGIGSFENDDAFAWVDMELQYRGAAAIEEAIQTVLETNGYLDLTPACEAIAACETLAAQQGRPGANLPDEVQRYVMRRPAPPSDALRQAARSALDRIVKDSELRSLIRDNDAMFQRWQKHIADLRARL